MHIERVAVVIPFYHSDLSELEMISLRQCIKKLKRYPIILLIPENMMIEDEMVFGQEVSYQKISSDNFKSVATYNKMLLSVNFYKLFSQYEYILVYQLDAFVFFDRLLHFCDLQYDYIGAPWVYGTRYYSSKDKGTLYVGNGGFSLRRIDAFIRLLKNKDTSKVEINEDVFFSGQASDEFRVAPIEVALQFAIERDVRKSFELNGYNVPFGCHAWEKHDFSFWKPYIEAEGGVIESKVEGKLDITNPAPDLRYLDFDREIIKSFMQQKFNGKKIYIFGAGVIGEECGWLLRKADITNFSYFDNRYEKDKYLWEKEITKPHKKVKDVDCIVILATKGDNFQMKRELLNLGYENNDILFYQEVVKELRKRQRV